MEKTKYTVLSPVEFDKTRFEIGSTIELEEKDAKALLDVKVIELATDSAPAAPEDAAERKAAIVAAIGKLDKEDKSLWTTGGAPKAEAITAVTGWIVSGKERDAVWAEIGAAK